MRNAAFRYEGCEPRAVSTAFALPSEPFERWLQHPLVRVVRPLIDVERADIIRYLRARDLDWVEDESNADLGFRRNLVRLQIVPLLKQLNPAAVVNARRCAALLAAEDEFLGMQAEEALRAVVEFRRGRALIDTRKLRQYNLSLRRRIVRLLWPELDAEGVARVLNFAAQAGPGRSATGCVDLKRRNGIVEAVIRKKGKTRQRTCRGTDF